MNVTTLSSAVDEHPSSSPIDAIADSLELEGLVVIADAIREHRSTLTEGCFSFSKLPQIDAVALEQAIERNSNISPESIVKAAKMRSHLIMLAVQCGDREHRAMVVPVVAERIKKLAKSL